MDKAARISVPIASNAPPVAQKPTDATRQHTATKRIETRASPPTQDPTNPAAAAGRHAQESHVTSCTTRPSTSFASPNTDMRPATLPPKAAGRRKASKPAKLDRTSFAKQTNRDDGHEATPAAEHPATSQHTSTRPAPVNLPSRSTGTRTLPKSIAALGQPPTSRPPFKILKRDVGTDPKDPAYFPLAKQKTLLCYGKSSELPSSSNNTCNAISSTNNLAGNRRNIATQTDARDFRH